MKWLIGCQWLQKTSLPLLVLLVSSVYLCTAAGVAITDDGDALYAHVAQQMIARGDWVTPYANGVRFLDKPPLLYWLIALAYAFLGMTELAARLPSVLSVLGIGVLLYLAARRVAGPWSGLAAGVASAFCIGTFLFTRMVFPEVLFLFCLTLGIWAFMEWHLGDRDRALPAMLFYASVAGAALSKGLIGVFFPVAIVLLFVAWTREWKKLMGFHIGKGSLLFLVLALPWHVLVAYRNPGFLWHFFLNEQLLRFLGRRQPVDYESISLPVFWVLMLLWLFPWCAFLPAVRHVFQPLERGSFQLHVVTRLSLCWAVVVLGFFSVSSRIEHYALPAFPPLALLIGITLNPGNLDGAEADSRRQRSVGRSFAFLGILGGTLGAVFLAASLAWLIGRPSVEFFREASTRHLHAYSHYFAPLFDFPPQILTRLFQPVVGVLMVLSLGMLGAWWLGRRGMRMRAILLLCAEMAVFFLFAYQSQGVCEEVLSSKQFALKLREIYRPGDHLITVGDFETANSINFYARVSLYVYKGRAAVLEWGLRYPDAPVRVLSRADLEKRWNGSERVFLLSPDPEVETIKLEHTYPVMRSAGRTLLCNQPPN